MNKNTAALILTGLMGLVSTAQAAPTPADFAWSMQLQTPEEATSYTIELPPAVYQSLTRRDLGDLRVFDANGTVVQHALCPNNSSQKTITASTELTAYPLPRGSSAADLLGSQLSIKTAQGTVIQLQEPAGASVIEALPENDAPGHAFDYVLDARALKQPIAALLLKWDWQSAEGRAELALRVEVSNDLNQWRTLVARSTLLRAEAGERRIQRDEITLPTGRYAFLRLVPLDEQARDWLQSVNAEQRWIEQYAPAMTWFEASIEPIDTKKPHLRRFRSDRLAPIVALQLGLPEDSLVLQVTVNSRKSPEVPWRQRVNGSTSDQHEAPSRLVLDKVQDPFWQVAVTEGAEALGNRPLGLRLGYVPAQLRFLSQGLPPYQLAYGSETVQTAKLLHCAKLPENPATAIAADVKPLGGGTKPPTEPEPTPIRLILLWIIIGGGALLVIVMAMSLLRKLKQDKTP